MSPDPSLEERLLSHHLAALREESGLPEAVIGERGYFSASSGAEVRRLGFAESQCLVPALVVPLWNVSGERAGYVIRPDVPRVRADGTVAKYEAPTRSRPILDVPPRCRAGLADPSVTLYITEGAKKADALAARGACAINLSGVWSWRGTNELGGKTALPDWDSVALNERLVRLVFDSDVVRKKTVAQALLRLKRFLELRQAVVDAVYLPPKPDGSKQGVDDFLAAGHTLEDLNALSTGQLHQPERAPDSLPEIVVNGRHLDVIADDCWKVLGERNRKSPFVFKREARLVSVRRSDGGEPYLYDWQAEDVSFCLERFARFVRVGADENGSGRYPSRIPKDVVSDLLIAWDKPVPVIRGIVRTPVFAADGRLATVPGYQPETLLHYAPAGNPVPNVPMAPSAEDLARAKSLLLDEWLGDFPLVGEASRAHAVGAALVPVARELISGPTPLAAIDAPKQGTGKGLLAQTLTLIVTGASPSVMTEPRDGEEERKRVTATLRPGPSVILIDNVKHRLDSGVLAAVLTSEYWSDRILGVSDLARLPNRALWLATGNNLQFDGEVARRVVRIRLDAKVDRPWERECFRHADLPGWVREHRHELVWALLVLVQHWISRGRPPFSGRRLGSFEGWSNVVGGILETAGISGFLQDRDELYASADSETEEWRLLAGAWRERFGDSRVKAADLAVLIREQDLLLGLIATIRGEVTEQKIKVRLGKALAARRDQRIGDVFVRVLGHDAHQKGMVYALEAAEDWPSEVQPSANPPHENWSIPDSTAEDAEGAEDDPDPRAREATVTHDVEERQDEAEGRDRKNPPHPPHPPQVDSDQGFRSAEGAAEGVSRDEENPPRAPGSAPQCTGCGMRLSVVAVSDRCRYCRRADEARS